MSKGLKTLIRLNKFNVDEKRRVLTALQAREDQILADMEAAKDRLHHEQTVAAGDSTGAGFYYGSYASAYLRRREQMAAQLAAVRQQIVAARDDLAEAYRELKTFEISQANRDTREQEERDRTEQAVMDEIGQTLHRRKDGGGE